MEPISTALTGLALARQGIAFLRENMDAASDAKAMATQLANVFTGHAQFNKQRYDGTLSLKEVAEQRIEMRQHVEMLHSLRVTLDLRFGHGFYDSIQKEFQEKVRKQKEQEQEARRAAIRRRIELERQIKVASIAMGAVTVVVTGIAYFFMRPNF
jgi:hypothetical protein